MKKRIAICPTDMRHDRFVTVTHVTEDWIVDREGNFESIADNLDRQTVHGPSEDNDWCCTVCGSCADFTDTEDFGTKEEDSQVLTFAICDHCSHAPITANEPPCCDCTVTRPSNYKPQQ